MLRQLIAGLLLLLHIVSFSFVYESDDQDRYVTAEKLIDQSGAGESDYYLYSVHISFGGPAAVTAAGYGNLYKEEMHSFPCPNIISPPPERATL
jgi:hypothetical protein